MTQDQYGQTRGPGYVRDDAVLPDDENEDPTGESKPMTRFQKVASALRGGPERDEQDQAAQAADPQTREAGPPRLARQDQVTGQADPDLAGHPATQPDMFGTTTHAANGATSAPYPQDRVGDAANGLPAGGTSPGGAPAGDVAAGDVAAGDVPAGEVTGTTGRHAAGASAGTFGGASAGTFAGASAGTESRPGEAAGTMGDFSDLTFGNLIPDATVYLEQWQQVQFKFVDDPHASVTEAANIVAQVTARLEAAIQERQRAIEDRQRAIAEQQRSLRDRWGEGTNADTEGLRETLRMYRTFIDQLIGSRAG